jgi:8-oxo-dGTP pyrophosphatase MutT (NUDIX family)
MSKNKESTKNSDETTCFPEKIEFHGVVYEDEYKSIEKYKAQFDGFRKEYLVTNFGEKAAVVALKNDCVLLVRQYRLLLNDLSFEIPGGLMESGETPEEGAIRECFEESGVILKNLHHLIRYDPDLEYTKNHTYVFYTEEIENIPEGESDRFVWIPLTECMDMILERKITDSLTLIALLSYQLRISLEKK